MGLKLRWLFTVGIILLVCSFSGNSQSCLNTGLNGQVINLPCAQNCVNVPVQVPDLKSTETYRVVSIPYTPFPYVTSAPPLSHPCSTSQDDKYFDTSFLPFKFCFYGAEYTKLVVGSNGLLTFDTTNVLDGCHFTVGAATQLPYSGTGAVSQYDASSNPCPFPSGSLFPRASIMGVYHDIDITQPTSPNKKIEARVEGTAPCRRFVVSFFEIPLFSGSCNTQIATSQIVLYESTGIIDVFVGNNPSCTGASSGYSVLGIQNWNRDQAVFPAGRNSGTWTASNEAYRFIPSGPTSRFVSTSVETLTGTPIATGTATPSTASPGMLDITFPTFCPTGTGGQYVVKSIFYACDNPTNQLTSYDTITINKTSNLNATATATQTSCGAIGTGTITVNVPTGIGTGPYTYTLDARPPVSAGSTTTFTAVAGGAHTVVVADQSGCSSTIPITVTSTGVLMINLTGTNTTCPGVNNGTITVGVANPNNPVTYYVDLVPRPGPVITGLAPGTYFISVEDAGGCRADFVPITIDAGSGGPTGTVAVSPTACPGVNNGSITVTPTSGAGPFEYSINGGTTWQTSATFPGLAAGTYSVIIREAGTCRSNPITAVVTAGTGVVATISNTATACTGVNTGTITVTAPTNGTAPFTYVLDGTTTQSSSAGTTFTNLPAGPHSVVITDAAGCRTLTPLTTTIATGAGFTATFTATATSCAGSATGSLVITPTAAGTAPFTFLLDGTTTQTSSTSTTFTGLTSGNHTVLITDANGCRYTVNNAAVPAGPGITATITNTATACTGVSTGTITVTPTNGTAPYTAVLDGTTTITITGTSGTFNNVGAGSHAITITTPAGCSTTIPLTTTVTTGGGFTATSLTTATTCVGAANGTTTITPSSAGVPPFTYVLGTRPVQTSNVFTGLAQGSYSVLVTDAIGCQFTVIGIDVNNGPTLAATVTPTPTACPTVSNGSILVTPTNGTGPYTFVRNPGNISLSGATANFTNVAAGQHTITITDANSCTVTLPPVTVAAGTGVTATITPGSTSCIGATNGTILISPTNGTAPYTFVLNGTTTITGTTATFNGLSPGNNYNITVSDAIGCTGSFSNIAVAQGTALLATATPTATSCIGASNGRVVVTPSNGGGPYTFVLNPGNISQTAAVGTFNNLAPNTYSVVVTDAANCISSPITVTVTAGPALTTTAIATNVLCNGASTGSITVAQPTIGTAPYEYSLNNTTWQSSPVFTGLAANSYTVYYREANGCSGSVQVVVTQPTVLAATTTAKSVTCNGAADGGITVTATGGVSPYQYSLNGTTWQPNNTFSMIAGNYTVYVRDANNCQVTPLSVTVTQPAPLAATNAAPVNATCNGGADGQITITATGGTAPYQYASNGTSFQAGNTLNVNRGTYTQVTVKDANGCTFVLPSITVGLTDNLTWTPMVDPAPICESKSTQLNLVSNAASFAWTPATTLSSATIANPVATPGVTTTYTVEMTLGVCKHTDDVIVTILPAPIANAGDDKEICFGLNTTINGSGGTTFSWSPATYLSSATAANPTVTRPEKSTSYFLTVTDANGCSSLTADQVTVRVIPPFEVYTFPSDTVVYDNVPIPLLAIPSILDNSNNTVTPADISYEWTPTTGLNDPFIFNPVAVSTAIGDTITYTVTASTPAGCQGQGTVKVIVFKGPELYTPNAFTPNRDGRNDTFYPFPVGIVKLNYFRVFNRWGQIVFNSVTLNKGWDGTLSLTDQPAGVYVWMAEGVDDRGNKVTRKGSVVLIR